MVLLAKCFPLVWKSTLCANSVSTSSISNYSFVKFLNLAGDENRKTKNKQKPKIIVIAFPLHLSFKNCSKIAFTQNLRSLSLARTQSVTLQTSKKTAFLNVCFFMKMCSMKVFYYNSIWFIFFCLFHFTPRRSLSLALSCVSSFSLAFSQRFIQKTIVRLCVCVCVIVLNRRVAWFCFGCNLPCLCVCCSIKSLIWYKFHR